MNHNSRVKLLKQAFALIFMIGAIASSAHAATVTVTGSGSTFIINKLGGFDDNPTYGAQRESVFVAAAQIWADILVSSVPIVIDAQFVGLTCTSTSATLGSAGPTFSTYSPAATPPMQNNLWYPVALANSLLNSDLDANTADIFAQFNSNIDNNNACLNLTNWYYGLDHTPTGSDIDLFEVVLHEIGHGLGISSLVDAAGNKASGIDDTYSIFLKDKSTGVDWSTMSASQRLTSMTDTGDLVWNGIEVNALIGSLSAGVNGGEVQMYAPSPYQSGSSVSHFDIALTPDELMEPNYTGGASYDHTVALLKDIGWTIYVNTNAAPVITGLSSALSTNEETAITLTLNDLTVTDSDNSYPTGFTLTVSDGTNYTRSGTTVTPSLDFTGTLTVPVIVNDGTDDSASYNVLITVNNLNDKPVISGQSTLSLVENTSLTLDVTDLTIVDPDDVSFTLSVAAGTNYTVSGQTITPAANYFGALTVPVTVNDGKINSDSYNLSVSVIEYNTVPVITGQLALNTAEDTDITILLTDLTVLDNDNNYPTDFSLTLYSGSNYTFSGTTVTPATDFSGDITIPITVHDGTDSSASFNLIVTVNSVNDKPNITDQVALNINEDTDLVLTTSDLTIVDPDDSIFTLSVAAGTNYTVSGQTITPDENYNGTLTVPVTVNDGEINSNSFSLVVTVAPINDAPSITAIPSITFDEDTNRELLLSEFTILDVDSSSFTLVVEPGNNYTVIGTTIYPLADFSGNLSVNFYVTDSIASSAIETLIITINPINDAPQLSGTPLTSIVFGNLYSVQFSSTDVENDSLTYSIVSNHDSWLSIGATTGLLTGTPLSGNIGSANVTVNVSDGSNTSSLSFTLDVIDATDADLSTSITTSTPLTLLSNTANLSVNISNMGPSSLADGYVLVSIDPESSFQSVDSECVIQTTALVRCDFTNVASNLVKAITVTSSNTNLTNVSAEVFGTQPDPVSENNWSDVAVIFDSSFDQLIATHSTLDTIDSRAIAFGDITKDGTIDLIVANNGADNILSFSSGFVALTTDSTFSPITNSNAVVTLDINNDGALDVAFANSGANTVYLNNGSGSFGSAISLGTNDSTGVVSTDLNQDGYADLVFSNSNTGNTVYLNNQNNGFVLTEVLGNSNSTSVAVVDYNRDSWPDVIFTNVGDDDFVYLNNNTNQSSSVFNTTAVLIGLEISDSTSVVVTDLNNDGLENEIIIGKNTASSVNSIEIFQVSQSGVVSALTSIDAGDIISLSAGDYDNNGELDIVALNSQKIVQLFLQVDGTFSRSETFISEFATAVALLDINGNSEADLVVLYDDNAASKIYLSQTPEPGPAIAAPTGLIATSISSSQINVSWVNNANNATNYIAENSKDGVNFVQLASLPASATSFQHIGIPSETTLYYRVYATNGTDNSSYSNIGSAKTKTAVKKSGGAVDWPLIALVAFLGLFMIFRNHSFVPSREK